MMNELSQQMMEDAKALSEMSMEFKAELEKLFSETGQQMADQASRPGGPPSRALKEPPKRRTRRPRPAARPRARVESDG